MLAQHLDFLSCPTTEEELSLDIEKTATDGHIESGKLRTSADTYPIVNGVPRFILSQSSTEEQTVKAFGDQWHEADEAILHYGQDQEYFSAYFAPLEPNAFRDAVVLDAGCGNGRLLEYALGFEPRMIVGIDYSRAIDLAFTRTRHRENALVVQGSLLAPPLRRECYDLIYPLGVVHHLESPEKGLRQLGDLLEDDGVMHVWTYSREGNELYLALVGPLRQLSRWRSPRAQFGCWARFWDA
jgi:SAM-dependent methyltransferase